MKRVIAALAGALLLGVVSGAEGATLPWTTFSEASTSQVAGDLQTCTGRDEVFVARLEYATGTRYQFWFVVETGRLLWAVYPPGADDPSELGTGILGKNPDVIPPISWVPFNPAIHVNPCTLLYPKEA